MKGVSRTVILTLILLILALLLLALFFSKTIELMKRLLGL